MFFSHNKFFIYSDHYFYLLLPLNILPSFKTKFRSFCLSSISAFCCSSNFTSNFLSCSRWYSSNSSTIIIVFMAFFFCFCSSFFGFFYHLLERIVKRYPWISFFSAYFVFRSFSHGMTWQVKQYTHLLVITADPRIYVFEERKNIN